MNFKSLFILCLAMAAAPASRAAVPAPGTVPRPCFVPAHPLKQGHPPRLERPSSRRAFLPSVPTEDFAYHDDHLLGVASPEPRIMRALAILVDFDEQVMGAAFTDQRADSVQLYVSRTLRMVHDMYLEMSDGQLVLEYTLTPRVYRLPEPLAYYGLDDSIATREAELCRDAVEAADPDVDFSQFNTFFLIHAGPGQEADIYNDSQELVWSVFFRQIDFQYWLDAPDAEFGIRTQDVDSQGQPFYVNHTVICPEYESQDGFEFGHLGVTAHEFGHRFGLPDLYDTTGPADFIYADSQGIGTFGLMGAGIWNDNGFFPAEMEAWSKFYVGWLRPRILLPDEEGRVDLLAVQHDRRHAAVRIPLGGDEYFLIENRLRDYNGNGTFDFGDSTGDGDFDFWEDSVGDSTEFDWHLPQPRENPVEGEDGSGLLIWHVDESVVRDWLIYNLVNAEALHKGVDLEEADGIQDLDRLVFEFEAFGDFRDSWWAPNAVEFTPLTEPDSKGYNDAQSQIWITDISASGDTMSFDLRFSSPSGNEPGDFLPGWPVALPGLTRDFQPVTGDLDGDGDLEVALGVTAESGNGGVVLLAHDGSAHPGGGAPAFLATGQLRAEPILVNLDRTDTAPEIVWVSGDTVFAAKGNGMYLTAGGPIVPGPAPFYVLGVDPGRVHLSSGDVDGFDGGRPEILLGVPTSGTQGALLALAWTPAAGSRVMLSVPYEGSGSLPHVAAQVDTLNLDQSEIVSSIRTAQGGYLQVAHTNVTPGDPELAAVRTFSIADTVALSAPAVGDVDRDGLDEIAILDSEGGVHLLGVDLASEGSQGLVPHPSSDGDFFSELPGWPREIATLASVDAALADTMPEPSDGEVSLADVDGDGFLEVLVVDVENVLHVFNYNGSTNLSLPFSVPAEYRFAAPILAPLALDVAGDAAQEIVLPLSDGQVRAHDPRGRPIPGWSYLGGGNQGSYPVVADLDGNETLDLLTVEDVSVQVPEDANILHGDESGLLVKQGRAILRRLGPGTGRGDWEVYRHDAGRTGRATAPTAPVGQPEANAMLAANFVMPNPVRGDAASFHYEIRSDVQRVVIEVIDPAGTQVRRLTGSIYPGTDNLVSWDLRNEEGHGVAPGLYFARFQVEAGTSVEVKLAPFVVLR